MQNDLIGYQIGQYEIVEEIGQSGVIRLFRAEQKVLERVVMVKLLPRVFTSERNFEARFNREAKTIANLQHPHIVPLLEFGQQSGSPYIITAYYRGGTCAARIRESAGGLSVAETARIVQQIGGALDYAHRQGVVHRNVKPDNIVLDDEDNAYLADFGIAKVEEATQQLTGNAFVGTATYMAPEVAEGSDVTPLVDVYALGVTLYEMLTMRPPYRGKHQIGTLLAHVNDPIPNIRSLRPDLGPEIQDIVEKVLAKEPDKRYQSAGELADNLIEVAEGLGEQANYTPEASPVGGEEQPDTVKKRSDEEKRDAARSQMLHETVDMQVVDPDQVSEEDIGTEVDIQLTEREEKVEPDAPPAARPNLTMQMPGRVEQATQDAEEDEEPQTLELSGHELGVIEEAKEEAEPETPPAARPDLTMQMPGRSVEKPQEKAEDPPTVDIPSEELKAAKEAAAAAVAEDEIAARKRAADTAQQGDATMAMAGRSAQQQASRAGGKPEDEATAEKEADDKDNKKTKAAEGPASKADLQGEATMVMEGRSVQELVESGVMPEELVTETASGEREASSEERMAETIVGLPEEEMEVDGLGLGSGAAAPQRRATGASGQPTAQMSVHTQQYQSPLHEVDQEEQSRRKWLLWVIGGVLALCLLAAVATGVMMLLNG